MRMWLRARGVLTGGGGLARIDVADNDHVDVHLFLTAERWEVSNEAIKIRSRCDMMLLMSRWKEDDVEAGKLTHPMVAVLYY
jgi:hypothetical protein